MHLPIAFVDVETTGMNPVYDHIIDIGIIRLNPDGSIIKFQTLIDPGISIPPQLTAIHGIADEDLRHAPTLRAIIEDIHEVLDGTLFVAHNARFDYGFIKQAFKKIGAQFTNPYIDTVKISRQLYPHHSHHSVDALIEHFGFSISQRHRALPDAQVLYQFFTHINKQFGTDFIDELISKTLAKPMVPATIDLSVIDDLPTCTGVYQMYDQDKNIIYIGKSKNIRSRVLQHFSADMHSPKERKLSSNVYHIDYIPTAGEVGALLLESQLIKQHLPIYNRLLRNSHNMTLIIKDSTHQYSTLMFDVAQNISSYSPSQILGITKSRKSAQELLLDLANQHQLCKKILGLEKAKGSCFAYHLGSCKGACIGKESSELHNLRFDLAFSKTRLHTWPFSTPMTITEHNPSLDLRDVFVIDNWCITKKYSSKGGQDWSSNSYPAAFDIDSYRIITRYLHLCRSASSVQLAEFSSQPIE